MDCCSHVQFERMGDGVIGYNLGIQGIVSSYEYDMGLLF